MLRAGFRLGSGRGADGTAGAANAPSSNAKMVTGGRGTSAEAPAGRAAGRSGTGRLACVRSRSVADGTRHTKAPAAACRARDTSVHAMRRRRAQTGTHVGIERCLKRRKALFVAGRGSAEAQQRQRLP